MLWAREDSQALRDVGPDPVGQGRRDLAVAFDREREQTIGLGSVWRVEDRSEVPGDLGSQLDLRDEGAGVLLQMELAALPFDGGQDCPQSSLQAGVAVRAPGFAPWRGEVEVFEGRTAPLEVALFEGVTLEGTMRDASGPAA